MIAATVIEEIQRMLEKRQYSQRGIAQRLGVSRGTVNAVARGRRPMYSPRRRPSENGFRPPGGMPRRCPGCGGMVQMPCLLCYLRRRS
jgi:hypothetical protein